MRSSFQNPYCSYFSLRCSWTSQGLWLQHDSSRLATPGLMSNQNKRRHHPEARQLSLHWQGHRCTQAVPVPTRASWPLDGQSWDGELQTVALGRRLSEFQAAAGPVPGCSRASPRGAAPAAADLKDPADGREKHRSSGWGSSWEGNNSWQLTSGICSFQVSQVHHIQCVLTFPYVSWAII